MDNFNEAQKVYMDAKEHHADLLNGIKNLITKPPLTSKLRKIDQDMIAKEANSSNLPKAPLENIERLTWATAWMHPNVKYRMSIRKMHAEIGASEEILSQAGRKYARSIKSEIESQPSFKAMREQIGQAYWARVIAGIHMEWNQLVSEYMKQPGNDDLRRIKAEFVEKYNL